MLYWVTTGLRAVTTLIYIVHEFCRPSQGGGFLWSFLMTLSSYVYSTVQKLTVDLHYQGLFKGVMRTKKSNHQFQTSHRLRVTHGEDVRVVIPDTWIDYKLRFDPNVNCQMRKTGFNCWRNWTLFMSVKIVTIFYCCVVLVVWFNGLSIKDTNSMQSIFMICMVSSGCWILIVVILNEAG